MPTEDNASLTEAVIEALTQHPAGMTVTDLGRRLRTANLTELSRILLDLQNQRLTRPTGSRWQWIGPPRHRLQPGHRGTVTTSRPRTGLDRDRDGRPAAAPTPPAPSQLHTPASRWDEFRRLCRYYADYVRLMERASVRVSADREWVDFLQIGGAVDWASLEAGRSVTLRLPPQAGVFVRRGLSGSRLPFWFLGLPVDVFHGTDSDTGKPRTHLEPILVAAVQPVPSDNDVVTLEPLAPLEVNPGWLERRFKRANQKTSFLAAIGLDDSARGVLGESEEVSLRLGSFRTAIEALRVAYREWWREFPSIDGLQLDPPLARLTENGLHNRAILVSQPRLRYSAPLHAELLKLADPKKVRDEDLDRSALRTLFPHTAAESPPQRVPLPAERSLAEYALLNDEQRDAVCCALHYDLTVMTGPPGTGKSLTVRHVMAGMALEGRSVLFASRNHRAIEAVEPELNALVTPEHLVLRPSLPWGQEARTADWHRALIQLLSRPSNPESSERLGASRRALRSALENRRDIEDKLAKLLHLGDELAERQAAAQQATGSVAPELRDLVADSCALPERAVLEALLREVQSLRQARGPRLLRWFTRLIRLPLRLLRRDPESILRRRVAEVDQHVRAATGCRLQLTGPQDQWPAVAAAIGRALHLAVACEADRKLLATRAAIEQLPDHAALRDDLDVATGKVHEATKACLREIACNSGAELDPQTRQRFAELRAGLQNHRGSSSLERFERAFAKSLPDLLQHYPLWASSNLSVHKAIPFAAAAVDLLIVDEASQCDIPSVVPLLFRARRALIVGDPMQLGHISTLSRPAELRVRQTHGLVGSQHLERFTVGVNSIYDLAASSATRNALVSLRAHYRCHPQIANYFNRAFYSGTLRVMTNAARLKRVPGVDSARACAWTDIRGQVEAAASGCHNPAEVDAVVDQVRMLVANGFAGSLGVVTPFRAQANRIQDAVAAAIPPDTLNRLQFLSHTVDGFQGDERDVILFSLVAGPGMPEGSRGFLASTPNRFNVAISRARCFVRVIGNQDWASSCGIAHIQELLQVCESDEPAYAPRSDLIGPVWEPRLADALRAAGMQFHQQYPACGYYLDFAMVSPGFRLDIEVDGETWHRGADGKRLVDDLYRDHVLREAGWHVVRFWVYQLKDDIDDCIRTIRATWERGTRG